MRSWVGFLLLIQLKCAERLFRTLEISGLPGLEMSHVLNFIKLPEFDG